MFSLLSVIHYTCALIIFIFPCTVYRVTNAKTLQIQLHVWSFTLLVKYTENRDNLYHKTLL